MRKSMAREKPYPFLLINSGGLFIHFGKGMMPLMKNIFLPT